jgi:hypothetical protein
VKRLGLNVGSVVSFVALLATVVFWVRSYRAADYLAYCLEKREAGVISAVGSIIVYRESAIGPFAWGRPFGIRCATSSAPTSIRAFGPSNIRSVVWLGFGFIEGENGRYDASAVLVPHWVVAILTSILPIGWIRGWRKRKLGEKGFEVSVRV